jgi:hypothetical protein
VIGLLRFVGIVNAAIWLGAAIFFTFGAGPAIFSGDMRTLLGANNFPFFSGAIARIILNSYFHFQIACGVVALLHLAAGKLYLGRPVSKFTVGLLTSLLAITLLGGFWLQPKMHDLHVRGYSPKVSVGERATAMHSFRVWHGISQVINLFVIGGIIVYVWRVNNPPNPTQFVRPGSKFGG